MEREERPTFVETATKLGGSGASPPAGVLHGRRHSQIKVVAATGAT
jgi:hypothetical protein